MALHMHSERESSTYHAKIMQQPTLHTFHDSMTGTQVSYSNKQPLPIKAKRACVGKYSRQPIPQKFKIFSSFSQLTMSMTMKFACLVAATSVNAFAPQRKGAVHPFQQGLAANSGSNDDGGSVNIFDMVDDYWQEIWRDKKQNVDIGNLFGGVIPDAKLPSMPNLVDGFLKKQRSISPSTIESVEDFDLDLANEIEAALAMAENDVAGGSVHEFDYREQQQQPPLNSDPISSSANNIEAATAAATKAWLDNMSSSNDTSLTQDQYGYPREEAREQTRIPFFANNAEQYGGNDNGDNTSDYIGDSPFNRKSDENWSTNDETSQDRISAAAQTLADQSIRAGLDRNSVEDTYKMYKQYFEQGVQTTFDGGMNSGEAPSLQNNEDDDTKVFISDAAFDLAEALRLDPYEIYQHKQNNFDGGNFMIEEHDVRNYLDLRYEALLSNNKFSKPRQESRKRESREVDNRIYEERDIARRQRTRANKSVDYGRPRNDRRQGNDAESEGNWQSYYDTYKQMEEMPTNFRGSSAQDQRRHTQQRPRMHPPPVQRQSAPRNIPEQENVTNRNYEPQKPRESTLSKLVFETKTEKLNGRPSNFQNSMTSQPEPIHYEQVNQIQNSPPSRMQSQSEPMPSYEQMNQVQNSPSNRYVDNNRRDQSMYSKGLGINKNYPQDRSYRETRHKNSIDMISRGDDEDMSYEEYNAYFAHSQRPNNSAPHPIPTKQGTNLKGLLENRIDQNLHKQELYDQQQQRYLDERIQRDLERVSRLTQVQDQQKELGNRLQQRELQHHQEELDHRLERRMQRLSETTRKVSRDAQRAIEDAQNWFADGDQNQNR